MTRFLAARNDRERGAVLVLMTLVMTALLASVALVIDLGQLRARARIDQSVADLAALSAGPGLAKNDPASACKAAVRYLNINAQLSPAINATTFCAQSGNDVTKTTCSGGSLAEAMPSTTVGPYTVSVHFPVPASEITDNAITGGARLNDGVACQRLRVIVTAVDQRLFSRIFGTGTLATTRSATVRPSATKSQYTPALWLLDPTGCTTLSITGGSQVTVGTATIAGIVTSDSDGSTCSSNQDTVSVSGSGTKLTAIPTSGATAGRVELLALPVGATSCSDPACNAGDVTGGRLSPQPVAEGTRATRAAVDWKYNCKTGYPLYHSVVISDCPYTSITSPYIDLLRTAAGSSGVPPSTTTFQRWTTSHSCNPPGTISAAGNWWVDCPGGLSIGNGTSVTFTGGNLVLDGGISMTGGVLNVNTNNPISTLPGSCTPPTVTTPCIQNSSTNAAIIYMRNGDISVTGGNVNFHHVTVYQAAGVVKVTGGAPPIWNAPTEGPFAELGLWSELSSNKYQINGGAGVQLTGVFFTPEATPFSLSGNGNWGQQDAQFISYRFAVSGGGTLTMVPDPNKFVQPPARTGTLIR